VYIYRLRPCDPPADSLPGAAPPPISDVLLPVWIWIVCAVKLPSEFDDPPTITLSPSVRLLAEAVAGLMIEVELEKNTTSELPFGSWSVIVCPLIDAIFPAAKLPPVRLLDAPRDDAPKFSPFRPPANCRGAEDPIFPTKNPTENASITATAQMICTLYFFINGNILFNILLLLFYF
jgi:hypothetical protein